MTYTDISVARIERAARSSHAAIAALQHEIDAANELARTMRQAVEKLAGQHAEKRHDVYRFTRKDVATPAVPLGTGEI